MRVLRKLTSSLRSLWLALTLLMVLAIGVITAFRFMPSVVEIIGSPSDQLAPGQAFMLGGYLASRITDLRSSASSEPHSVAFEVDMGESATTVATRLVTIGLITDAHLLSNYMRYKGLDVLIETGYFELNTTQTIPEIASALTDAMPSEIQIRLWEGWRIEQLAHSLSKQNHLDVDEEEFIGHVKLETTLPGNYLFVDALPEGATLEGLLRPGKYSFPPGATAAIVLDQLLTVADPQLTLLRLEARKTDLSWYEVLTLASIVQRETIHDDEGPLIAGVFLHRLEIGMPLSADPTTQYGLAYPGNWWPRLTFDPRQVSHPYNTYITIGLPPGPICSPSSVSIRSVLYPETTDYLYFRAACDGSNRHNFAYTYEQHLSNACDP